MKVRTRKRLIASLIAASLVTATAAPTAVWAQSAYATLHGKAKPNTQITALNTATGTMRQTKATSDGSYTIVGLQPGTYTVDDGAGTSRTVTLTVASTSTLDFTTDSGTPSTANAQTLSGVTVTASNLPDVTTPEVATTISLHQIDTIPQISRNFLEFADTVPGVVFNVDGVGGNTSLRGGAQNNAAVNVYIDGVGQKSYLFGGPTGQNASQGNPFPQLAIGEYKVITSNYKAEYGQISSAAVTAQTKSGTNEFHGEVYDRYTNDGYRARTPAENDKNFKTPSQEKEYGFALGGPIIKDKAHFFVTYEGKRFNTPVAVVPDAEAVPGLPGLPASAAAQLGPANRPFSENLYFTKFDWEPTDRDRFELSAQIRKESQIGGVGGTTGPSAAFSVINNDKRYTIRWQHSGYSYFNELLYTYEDSNYAPTAITTGNGAVYTYAPDGTGPTSSQTKTIVSTGGADPRATQNKGQKGPAIEDNLTFNDFQWHGDHVIKMGFKYKWITLHSSDAGATNPQFFYNVTPSGTDSQPYEVIFPKPVTGLGLSPMVTTKDKQLGTYIQDDWAVNDKLTLNLGVRWDYEKTPSYLNFVTPSNVVAALYAQDPNAPAGQTYADSLAKGGINVADYISNGHNRSAYKGEWQPRLGFSYDVNADQAHVIHGGAGRSYDRDLYNYLQLEVTKSALPQFTYYFQDPNSGLCYQGKTPCVPFDPSYLTSLSSVQSLASASNTGTEVDLLNNKLKAPYSDQFSLGMANRVGDWQTDATVTRVLSHDGFAFTLGNRYPDGTFFKDGGQPWNNGVPGFGSLIVGNNGIETRTTQVLLSANKPYTKQSHWGVTLAYTYTDAKQNRDINEHYSFDYATINDYPFIVSNAASKHRFVATGVVDGPWGLVFSAKLTLATPIPFNSNVCYATTNDPTTQQYFPNGSKCSAYGTTPEGNGRFLVGGKVFGYRDVDFQATKNFSIHGMDFYGRFDLLNVFNFKNLNSTLFPNSTVGSIGPVTYNPTGDITFVPRTIKFEVGMKF
ncbi:TonB-dependent receptor [Oleiagrimonas soli]|nr:membrane protein [Oleiagrimonas soli]